MRIVNNAHSAGSGRLQLLTVMTAGLTALEGSPVGIDSVWACACRPHATDRIVSLGVGALELGYSSSVAMHAARVTMAPACVLSAGYAVGSVSAQIRNVR